MGNRLIINDLGKKSYHETYNLQLDLVDKIYRGKITDDILLLVEHPSIFTIGKGGTRANIIVPAEKLRREKIRVYEIDRGGDITYHGPGQLVGYPILNLKEYKMDLHWLLHSYEEVFIRMLRGVFGLKAMRIPGLTGVWVNNEKIVAIGVGVKHWITFHGFAFNIAPSLEYFKYIIPCGIADKGITSIQKLFPEVSLKWKEMVNLVVKYFAETFQIEVV